MTKSMTSSSFSKLSTSSLVVIRLMTSLPTYTKQKQGQEPTMLCMLWFKLFKQQWELLQIMTFS